MHYIPVTSSALGENNMTDQAANREEKMRNLATKLLFDVGKHGSRFSLYRDAGVPEPVRREDLTLEEAEEILDTWKLRGFQGG